jgi:hypothetical protein
MVFLLMAFIIFQYFDDKKYRLLGQVECKCYFRAVVVLPKCQIAILFNDNIKIFDYISGTLIKEFKVTHGEYRWLLCVQERYLLCYGSTVKFMQIFDLNDFSQKQVDLPFRVFASAYLDNGN